MTTLQMKEACGQDFGFADRDQSLRAMRDAAGRFYAAAIQANCHPFVEFAGLINEYIRCCEDAHVRGVDFTACSVHTGLPLPMTQYQIDYVNEKLSCIFTGRSVIDPTRNPST